MPDYIGYRDGAGYTEPTANVKYAFRVQASSSFTAKYISVDKGAAWNGGEYGKLAIYSDNSGEPDALLRETGAIEGETGTGWKEVGLSSPLSIISGSYYWLAVLLDHAGSIVSMPTGGTSRSNSDTYSDGFADPFGSTSSGTIQLNITASDGMRGELSAGGGILEASDGTKIAVVYDPEATSYGHLRIWKNIDVTPVLVDWASCMTISEAGDIGGLGAAIDSNDDIHIVVASKSEYETRDVAYNVCDLTTGLGTWEEVANYTEAVPTNPGCAISIDSNDYPHILFVDNLKQAGSAQDNIYYTNKVSGWLTPEQIGARATKTDVYNSPRISHAPNDDVEAFYYFSTAGDPAYRRRNGTWNTESVYTETDAVIGGVVVTTSDTVYRYHTDTDEDIEENDVDTTYNADTTSSRVSASLVGTDRYIFYIDTSDDVHVISNDGGGWTDESAQQTGTYFRVIAEWAYNNENQSGEINYIFDDGTNVYYDSFSISALTQVYKDTQLKWDMYMFVYDDLQIKWDIFDVIGKELQLVWDIFDTVYKDLQAVWDMRELVYQDIQAVWDMSGAVFKDLQAVWDIFDTVYKDTQLKWDMLELVGRELQSVWDIFILVGQEIQAKWDMRELVGNELQVVWDIFDIVGDELQAKWDILNEVYQDIQAKWDIRELVYKDIEAVWDMSGVVGKELQAIWDIFDTVYQDTQIVWDIFDTVYQDVQAKWDILVLIGKELQTKWDIRELVYQDIELVWDILSTAAQVFKDMQAKWDIRELVSKDIQSVWDIFDIVGQELQAKWDILVLVGKEMQAKWDIRELVGKELQSIWDIRELVYQDIQAVWNIFDTVYQNIQAKWDVLNLVNKSIEAKYDIRELIGKELQSVWDILNLVGQEVQAKWDISILVTKSIEAKWDILNLVNNSINALWDVHELVGRSLIMRWDILNGAPPEEGGGKVGLRQTAYRWARKVGR